MQSYHSKHFCITLQYHLSCKFKNSEVCVQIVLRGKWTKRLMASKEKKLKGGINPELEGD